jgi:hypothetical protein
MAQNIARTQGGSTAAGPSLSREQRKTEINKTLASSRVSTASMGRFDKVLEGEKKLRGVKRKARSLLLLVMHGRLTCVCSLNPLKHPSSGKRQRILLSYRRWKGSRARREPRKRQGTASSMFGKPFVPQAEGRAASHWPDLLGGEAEGKANQDDDPH